jgi:predicted ATP-grasp superfamily ATP-dependent carboligase
MPASIPDHQQPPYAIIIGLDCITGLQTARILARRRVPVIGIARSPKHIYCRTRVCEKILFADTHGDEFIRSLEVLSSELKQEAVLYPCTDMSVLVLSRHRRRLEERYHIVLPDPDVVETLMDKVSFYTYTQKAGLPVPGTFFLRSRADAEQAAQRLTFPCILKPPVKTPTWQRHVTTGVLKVSDEGDFLAVYDRCSTWAEQLIVQEWIEGGDSNLYACNCYFNADSQPVVTFVSRKLRQWPAEAGNGCFREECRNDVVLQETIRLFGNLRYRGLGYLEMKRDERTGRYFIVEPNIGRPTGGSAIAEAGGVDLLYTMYCDAIGWPLPASVEQKYGGVRWIHLSQDLRSAVHYWRHGNLSLKEWWRSWLGRKTYAAFSWTDPLPFWGELQIATQVLAGYSKTKMIQSIRCRTGSGANPCLHGDTAG